MQGQAPLQPLITPPAPQPRQNKQTLLIAGGVVVVGAMVAIIVTMGGSKPEISRERAERPIPEASAVGAPSLPPADLRMQTTYAGARLAKSVPPAFTPAPPAASPAPFTPVPVSVPTAPGRPDFLPPEPPPRLTPPPAMPAAPLARPSTPAPAPAVPAKKEEPRRWFAPAAQAAGDLMAPPFSEQEQEQEKEKAGKESRLFPKATWETPADPLRVIYSSQLLHCLTDQDIVTGESSTVRCTLTQTLYDKFGQQTVLLPVDSRILGSVEGNVKYGQTRVGLKIDKAELPNGTDLLLTGKGGDAGGAVGIPGKVDNKYGQVVLATLLTTALSVGSRVAVPTSDSYRPKPEEEFAASASRSLNQSGQDVVRRSLEVQPTIFVKAGTPVTLQLNQNVSLQTPPVIVRR